MFAWGPRSFTFGPCRPSRLYPLSVDCLWVSSDPGPLLCSQQHCAPLTHSSLLRKTSGAQESTALTASKELLLGFHSCSELGWGAVISAAWAPFSWTAKDSWPAQWLCDPLEFTAGGSNGAGLLLIQCLLLSTLTQAQFPEPAVLSGSLLDPRTLGSGPGRGRFSPFPRFCAAGSVASQEEGVR